MPFNMGLVEYLVHVLSNLKTLCLKHESMLWGTKIWFINGVDNVN